MKTGRIIHLYAGVTFVALGSFRSAVALIALRSLDRLPDVLAELVNVVDAADLEKSLPYVKSVEDYVADGRLVV